MSSQKPNNQAINDIHEKKLELEYEQWECQKEWHKQENEIENKKLKQARLDMWIRGLVSGILATAIAVVIPAFITSYANKVESEKTTRAAEQRKQETLIQLINSRESSDSNLRSQMFTTLLQHYFQPRKAGEEKLQYDERDYRTQIAILETIGLNFRDSFHFKPMFEQLHIEIKEKAKQPQELLKDLRNASGRIIKDQLQQIKHSTEGDVCEIEFSLMTKDMDPKKPKCFQDLAISLIEIEDDRIKVKTNIKNGVFLEGEDTNGDDFEVSFYDMPMIDYTSVASKGIAWKYSIVLKEINKDKNSAIIAIANLPEDTFGTSEEYKFDEMLKNYLIE